MQASKNIFWLSVSRAASLILLFVAYASLFRYLGPESSGKYQFVLSFVLMFAIISDFGIQQFITKKISEDPENKEKYFIDFLRFEILLSSFLIIAMVLTARLKGLETQVFYGILIAGFGMCVNTLTYPFLAVMTAAQDLKRVALINFINSLVNILVIFLAIVFKKGIVFLSSVQLLFGFIDIVLYRFFIKAHLPKIKIANVFRSFSFRTVIQILRHGWPFVLLVGFSALYNRIDVLLLASFLDYVQVGFYTAAYKFFDLLSFFPSVVSHTLFPVFAVLISKKLLSEVKTELEKYLRLMLTAALPLAVGGTLLAKPLVILVAGREFVPAADALSIIIWAIALLFIYIPLNSLVISQLTKKAALITGLNVVLNITGNIILIPKFGILAAAIMTVVSEAVQGIFYFYFVRSYITKFDFFKLAIKPFAAAVMMGVVIWPARNFSLALSLPLGVVSYGLFLAAAGFFKTDDWRFFKSFFVGKTV